MPASRSPESERSIHPFPVEEQSAVCLYRLASISYPNGSPWTLQQFTDSLSSPYMHYVGLYQNGSCIGFIGFFELQQEAEIHHMVISETEKQKGHGKWFLQTILNMLLSKGVNQVFLEVRVSNHPAISLYEKNGFLIAGKRPGYYTHPVEDAWIMVYAFDRHEKQQTKIEENECSDSTNETKTNPYPCH